MQVLKNRDLSRAGDLFSVPDVVIVNDLTNVVSELFFFCRGIKYKLPENFIMFVCHKSTSSEQTLM